MEFGPFVCHSPILCAKTELGKQGFYRGSRSVEPVTIRTTCQPTPLSVLTTFCKYISWDFPRPLGVLRGKSLFQHLGTIPLNKTLHHLNYPSLLAGCYSVKPIRLINKFVNQVGCAQGAAESQNLDTLQHYFTADSSQSTPSALRDFFFIFYFFAKSKEQRETCWGHVTSLMAVPPTKCLPVRLRNQDSESSLKALGDSVSWQMI